MTNKNKAVIESVLQLLEGIKGEHADLRIEAESSYDEAVFIGTHYAYLGVAILFLKIAISENNPVNMDVKDVFDDMAAVWPVSSFVLPTQEEVENLAIKFTPPKK